MPTLQQCSLAWVELGCRGQGFGQGSAVELDPTVIFKAGILVSSVALYGPMQPEPWPAT